MSKVVDDYIAANVAYRDAAKVLAPIINKVTSVARSLEYRPQTFMFTDTATGADPNVSMAAHRQDSAKDWPTAEEIQQALTNWREAHKKAVAAWEKLPAEAQASMKAPEKPDENVRHFRL